MSFRFAVMDEPRGSAQPDQEPRHRQGHGRNEPRYPDMDLGAALAAAQMHGADARTRCVSDREADMVLLHRPLGLPARITDGGLDCISQLLNGGNGRAGDRHGAGWVQTMEAQHDQRAARLPIVFVRHPRRE